MLSTATATFSFSFSLSFLLADPFFALFAHDANNRLSGMEESELLVCRPGGFVIGGMVSLAVRVYLLLRVLRLDREEMNHKFSLSRNRGPTVSQ